MQSETVTSPPAMITESLASRAASLQEILTVPPVILRSSLQDTPLSVELMFKMPVPFNTMSSFAKMTASVLVSPSAVKVPETVSVFSESVVVIKTLSADFT